MIYLMVLTLPFEFLPMMHYHMEQSVLMKMQLILRMLFVDQKLGKVEDGIQSFKV